MDVKASIKVNPSRWLSVRIPAVSPAFLPVILLYLASIQPFGSLASIFFVGIIVMGRLLLTPFRGLPATNLGIAILFLALLSQIYSLFIDQNILLFALYSTYLSLLFFGYQAILSSVRELPRDRILDLIHCLLLLDLLFNLPSVMIQLALHGAGDWVTGLSGLLLDSNLSQNRTNTIRACFMGVLAAFSHGFRRSNLALLSMAFNVSVLILATSMTSVLSAALAFAVCSFSRGTTARKFTTLAACGTFFAVGDYLNQVKFGSPSIIKFIMSVNTRWVPKLDAFGQYFTELVFQYPWMFFFGNGIGNFLSRFVLLANFSSDSGFPLKDQIAPLLHQSLVREHFIERYHLESGIVGSSILSTPWSGIMSLLLEWGTFPVLAGFFLTRSYWVKLWRVNPDSLLGSGKLLVFILLFNLFFDCYQDYVEVMIPFFIVSLIMVRFQEPGHVHRDLNQWNPGAPEPVPPVAA